MSVVKVLNHGGDVVTKAGPELLDGRMGGSARLAFEVQKLHDGHIEGTCRKTLAVGSDHLRAAVLGCDPRLVVPATCVGCDQDGDEGGEHQRQGHLQVLRRVTPRGARVTTTSGWKRLPPVCPSPG